MPLAVPTGDLFAWHRALRDANARDDADEPGAGPPVLSRQALALAFVIGTFMNQDGTTPPRHAPGLTRLSAHLGYAASDNRKAVAGLLRELQAAGYLVVTKRGGRRTPSLYAAAIPAPVTPATPEEEQAASDRAAIAPEPVQPAGSAFSAPSVLPAEPGSELPSRRAITAAARAGSDAVSTPQKMPETAVLAPGNCGPEAAHPSPSFSSPSPAAGRGTGRDAGRPSDGQVQMASAVVQRVFQLLSDQEAEQLSAGIAELRGRWELARRIAALCHLGAEQKLVEALARPYAGAREPGAVAASRVAELYALYGRPGAA